MRAFCPECGGQIAGPEGTARFAVCTQCAAILAANGVRWRLLMTEEWWPILASPGWDWLVDRRQAVLERLTKPHT